MQIISKDPFFPMEQTNDVASHASLLVHEKVANLDALVENLDGYVWSVDKDMRYIILNAAKRKIVRELIGVDARPGDKMLDMFSLLDPSKTAEWASTYQQALNGKGQRFVQKFIINQKVRHFEVAINPIHKGEVVTGISCFARDVTETIHNSEQLQASEMRFRSLIENSTDIIVVVNNAGEIVYGSPSIENHFGLLKSDYSGVSAFGFIHPDELEVLTLQFLEVLEKPGIPVPIKCRAIHKDGRQIWVEGSVTNLLQVDGINGIVCNCRDVTEYKKAEEQIQASEDLYRNLFNKSPLPTWVCCTEGLHFLEANEAAVRHYGYSRDEFLERTAFEITPAENHHELQALIEKGNINRHQQLMRRHVKKNGEVIFVEILAHTINYKGRPCYQIVANDITEKIRLRHQLMEEKIVRQRETMQASIDAQERERTYIGRELHDNVKQILGMAKICLEHGQGNAALQEEMTERAMSMIGDAIEEIRNLSKSLIQTYEREIGLQLSLENLVDSMRLGNRFQVKVDFSVKDEGSLDDKLKMTVFRIVQEQLNNIQKHAEAKQVLISVKQPGDVLSLSIVDDGKGFDVKQKREGIGLTNIINRAEIFNGLVEIDSAPGKGCKMLVNFKIRQ